MSYVDDEYKMLTDKIDSKIEDVWIQFKRWKMRMSTQFNLVNDLAEISDRLNDYQNRRKYSDIQYVIQTHIATFASYCIEINDVDMMQQYLVYVKRWNKVTLDKAYNIPMGDALLVRIMIKLHDLPDQEHNFALMKRVSNGEINVASMIKMAIETGKTSVITYLQYAHPIMLVSVVKRIYGVDISGMRDSRKILGLIESGS